MSESHRPSSGRMEGLDNLSAHPASEYDQNVRKSIPFYDLFHDAIADVVSAWAADPAVWVDVGCGTGTFVQRIYEAFPATRFILADPSAAMLEVAARKLTGKDRVSILKPVAAEELLLGEPADVVSAVQSLHYLHPDRR